MMRNTPPFRADHVGSLLRPPELHAARAKREKGEIAPEAFAAIEDRAVERVIAGQERVGLRGVTDGEQRRYMWNYDFFEGIDGIEAHTPEAGAAFSAAGRNRLPT